jgi:hypothetical protein
VGSRQKAQRMRRRAPVAIFVADTMRAARLLEMLPQQRAVARIEQAHTLGYIERLLANKSIDKYLGKHHSEILNKFRRQLKEKVDDISRADTSPVNEQIRTKRQATNGVTALERPAL